MRQKLWKQLSNQKGLTIIELLAVIVILAIIAAIAIPTIVNIISNSKLNAVKSDAMAVLNAANTLYFTDNIEPKDNSGNILTEIEVQELLDGGYIETSGKIPSDATISVSEPRTITTNAITFAGNKKVQFNGATVQKISDDSTKASEISSGGTLVIQ